MPHDKPYDAPSVARAFDELFDVLVAAFADVTERGSDVPILESSMGAMLIVFDFKERNAFVNYKGSATADDVHRLLRDYLDNPDAPRIKP